MAHLVRSFVFFTSMGLALWGFVALSQPWNWITLFALFLIGGSLSMLLFKRLATKQQIKDDLEARLHND